jgi:hypothetical protein
VEQDETRVDHWLHDLEKLDVLLRRGQDDLRELGVPHEIVDAKPRVLKMKGERMDAKMGDHSMVALADRCYVDALPFITLQYLLVNFNFNYSQVLENS